MMHTEPPVDIVRRLAFAKYVYTLGKVQAQQRWPLNAVALLMFHDAVEFFLQIASEYLDIGKAQPTFLDYWDLLSARTSEPLSHKEAMRRLNKARVALKHHGTTPSSEDVKSFSETTSQFFRENTQRIFGVSFAELTLVEFVEPPSARDRLQKVTGAPAGEVIPNEALVDLALAFEEIIGRREHEISPGPFQIFPFGRQFEVDRFAFRFNREMDPTVAQTLTSVRQAVGLLQRVCKLLVLGVDSQVCCGSKRWCPKSFDSKRGISSRSSDEGNA